MQVGKLEDEPVQLVVWAAQLPVEALVQTQLQAVLLQVVREAQVWTELQAVPQAASQSVLEQAEQLTPPAVRRAAVRAALQPVPHFALQLRSLLQIMTQLPLLVLLVAARQVAAELGSYALEPGLAGLLWLPVLFVVRQLALNE